MPPQKMRLVITTLCFLSGVGEVAAQSTWNLTGTPDAAIQEPFTHIAGVRELPGNRAIVTDQAERAVYLVDFSARSRKQIGRQGDGPAEYRFPTAPLAGTDGATWIFDATLRRVHVIEADGSFRPSLTPPYTAVPGGLLAARGVDARGRIYFEGNNFNSETGRFTDSVAILGWDPSQPAPETLGRFGTGGRVMVQREGGTASMARSILPFPHVDAWVPLPDGRVAIVRQSPHVIMFLERGTGVKTGPVMPFNPIPVTSAERAAYREATSANRMFASGGGGEARRATVDDAMFPAEMPAFIATSVVGDARGRIWIGRSFRSFDKVRRYDVYDGQGAHVGAATLPVGSRIAGFGEGVVYIARTDPADDLIYLERHRLK
jgi:hypothetical protein